VPEEAGAATPAEDAALAAAILAVDPFSLGGILLRGRAGGPRQPWLELLRRLLPDIAVRRLPVHVADDRLLGGLDLAATLAAGRPIAERGVLATTDGGLLVIPSAERLSAPSAARIVSALDVGEVTVERDGLAQSHQTRFAIIALDEGLGDDEAPPPALCDRLALHLAIDDLAGTPIVESFTGDDVAEAAARLPNVSVDDTMLEALCALTTALGIASLNAPLQALRVARCHGALCGRKSVADEDVAASVRLVLAPRATRAPMLDDESREEPPAETPDDSPDHSHTKEKTDSDLKDVVVAAALAAIPSDLLARLLARRNGRTRGAAPSGAGAKEHSKARGRPVGTKRGELRGGARLHLLETLRAAAPWQPLRARSSAANGGRRIEVRSEDFRVRRLKDRRETVTVFLVDASGSSALHRLAEAKGAVELLLADCYIRRDQVALIAFGGRGTELLLPPTRSLTRAKRQLADLPGGGGTPLAAALEQAAVLVQAIKRKRQTPALVVLTDGRPNLSRDGRTGRDAAEADAMSAARVLRESGIASLLIDTSSRTMPFGARVADAMGAQYLPLPHADAVSVSSEVRSRLGS
jgi:magnesium chelatase subunit D